MTKRYYAGIGSRETPDGVQRQMAVLASKLELRDWVLRSGHADGADQAFEAGVVDPRNMEIFLPWMGFNGTSRHQLKPGHLYPPSSGEAWRIAEMSHPAWHRCSQGAKNLHVRNVFQILGANLDMRVDAVVCWTLNAAGGGGTGQAIRLAKSLDIPVFDTADAEQVKALNSFFNSR